MTDEIASPKIAFSFFTKVTDRPQTKLGTWEQIATLMTRAPALAPDVPPPPAPLPENSALEVVEAHERHVKELKAKAKAIKLQAPAWSAATFDEGPTSTRRATADNVEAINLIMVDVDGADAETIEKMKARLAPYATAAATTFSHLMWWASGEKHAWRFVVRPSRPLTPEEWPTFWRAFQEYVCEGANDEATKNPDRKAFLSRVPDFAGALFESWRSPSAEPFDVDALLQRAAREGLNVEPERKPAAPRAASTAGTATSLSAEQRFAVVEIVKRASPPEGTGQRHSLRLALAGTFKNAGLSEDEADALVLDCDVSADDLDCRAAVSSTFGKADGDAYTAASTLATILGNVAADQVELILRGAATAKISAVIDTAVSSGPSAVCAPSTVRALLELQDRDPGAFAARMLDIGKTYRIKTELLALVKAERTKRDAAKRSNDSEFVEGADGRPISSVRNVATALRQQVQKVGAGAGQPRYRLNLLTLEIVDFGTNGLGPKSAGPLPVDDARVIEIGIELDQAHGLRVDKNLVWDGLIAVASSVAYDPIRDYLRSLKPWDGVDRIAVVARHISDEPLAPLLLKRWLVGAVARALVPGEKMDTMLVLRGPEGYFKSGLFSALAGEFFSDSDVDPFDKDGKAEAGRVWLHEYADLGALKGKDGDRMKAFLSSCFDRFRPAYARSSVRQPRRACFGATTNKERFLVENDGDRRFWIIPVTRPVPVELLKRGRDLLWAEAVATYDAYCADVEGGMDKNDSPNKWWLTREEDQKRDALNAEHRTENPWIERIREVAHALPAEFTMHDLASRHLMLTTADVDRWQVKIGQALRSLGFERGESRVNGGARRWSGGDKVRQESAAAMGGTSDEARPLH